MSKFEADWKTFLEHDAGSLSIEQVSLEPNAVIFYRDAVFYTIKAAVLDNPWRFEIVDQNQMIEKLEPWLNNVNEDFQGKLNEDPPQEFFAIMANHCREIFDIKE